MPSSTPTGLMLKAIALWVMVMLPTLLTLVTKDYTINIILLTVAFPIMLAFLINMDKSPFIVKTSVIGMASAITFFVMYLISKFVPRVKSALQDPGQNRGTTITIILLIASIYSISMGISGYFLPMFPIQMNMPANMRMNLGPQMPTY
jgi:hypothetical protein